MHFGAACLSPIINCDKSVDHIRVTWLMGFFFHFPRIYIVHIHFLKIWSSFHLSFSYFLYFIYICSYIFFRLYLISVCQIHVTLFFTFSNKWKKHDNVKLKKERKKRDNTTRKYHIIFVKQKTIILHVTVWAGQTQVHLSGYTDFKK